MIVGFLIAIPRGVADLLGQSKNPLIYIFQSHFGALAADLLQAGSAGIVYSSVRRAGGTCIVCFRPVLVTNVRKGGTFTFVFPDARTAPTIRRL